MHVRRLALALSFFALVAVGAFAQVPQLINYQGRVTVSGTGFTGTGQFKFALINGPLGTTLWSNDGTSTAGSQPTAAVSLAVTSGLYSVLLGDTTISGMVAIPSSVFANSDVRLRVWFNDGVNGSQLLTPDQRIAAVGYALMAGNVPDASITSAKLAAGAVTGSSIASGSITGTQLAAGTVTAGNLATGAAVANIATGTITGTQLASGAAAANLNAVGQTGVASSGLILSLTDNNTSLAAAGYVRLGVITASDTWQQRLSGIGVTPSARFDQASVWTGSEMIVWGGFNGAYPNDGGRYNPTSNTWTNVSSAGFPPDGRRKHTAVWTGSEMIVWGGNNGAVQGWGRRYNPISNAWATMTLAGAPSPRYEHSAVWTGTEMIIWGGSNGGFFNDGARYNPTTDSWTAVAATGAPDIRTLHTAVWTGTQMIIWGGLGAGQNVSLADGGVYDPATDSWTATARSGSPAPRNAHTALWTGTEMIVWGGTTGIAYLSSGGRYNPGTDRWTAVSNANSPVGRVQHSMVWTGSEVVVWGGTGQSNYYNTGGRYSPADNNWTTMSTANAPLGRSSHSAVWTGTEMIVWGGAGGSTGLLNDGSRYNPTTDSWSGAGLSNPVPIGRYIHSTVWTGSEMIIWGGSTMSGLRLNDGGRYSPVTNTWTTITPTGAPSARFNQTAVWTGTEMIVWGGNGSAISGWLNDGGRYSPTANSWAAVTTTGAPAGRYSHTAVWTGTEMIVWGGLSATFLNDGGRYNPAANSWAAVTTAGAPSARMLHTAVWTGSEMIIWGGATFGSSTVVMNDGECYDPASNLWRGVTATNAPGARYYHTALWTGSEMIVWGGQNTGYLSNGSRFNPASNTWIGVTDTDAPSARINHTAVWTGTEMIVWGGRGTISMLNDGGRYNVAENKWSFSATNAAPAARYFHSAVWTGAEMLVWGGANNDYLNDTSSYTPGRVLFLYQRP